MTRFTSKVIHIVKVGNHPHTNMPPKPEMVKKVGYKCRILEMHLQLRDQQVRTIFYIYIYRLLHQNFMVTANQKSKQIHIQIRKNNPNTTLKTVLKHKRKEQKKGRKKTNKTKSKTLNKMAIKTYISVITLNVNGLNAPTKRQRLAEWI